MDTPTLSDMHIRLEQATDAEAVRAVNRLAFGRPDEAGLVDALREAGAITLSLVATIEGRVVGHICFSPVEIDRDGTRETAVGLAPMAVLPERQRRGIGSGLVHEGLERLRGEGHGGVIVLGHPDYYPRFGFRPASRYGLRWEFDCPDEAFLAIQLRPHALGNEPGIVRFRPEFAEV